MTVLARRYVTPTNVRVGTLGEEVAAVAMRVYETLLEGPRLVWADEKARLFSSEPDAYLRIPATSIAGTYVIGQPITQIQDDLQALCTERNRDILG